MSGDFTLLILTAIGTAFGFWASLKTAPRHPAAWCAAVIFLAVGVQTVVHITLFGAGEILPGYQLNPEVQRYWAQLLEHGLLPTPRAAFCFAAILAYMLVVISKPSKATALLPLPATAFFVIYFFLAQAPREISFLAKARGEQQTAILTVIESGGRAEMWFGTGQEEDTFLRIIHRHEADSAPPDPTLRWSGDGTILTFTTRRAMPFFALDSEGEPTGWLPEVEKEWPQRRPSPADSTEYRRRLSSAQVSVTQLLNQHGGIGKR